MFNCSASLVHNAHCSVLTHPHNHKLGEASYRRGLTGHADLKHKHIHHHATIIRLSLPPSPGFPKPSQADSAMTTCTLYNLDFSRLTLYNTSVESVWSGKAKKHAQRDTRPVTNLTMLLERILGLKAGTSTVEAVNQLDGRHWHGHGHVFRASVKKWRVRK